MFEPEFLSAPLWDAPDTPDLLFAGEMVVGRWYGVCRCRVSSGGFQIQAAAAIVHAPLVEGGPAVSAFIVRDRDGVADWLSSKGLGGPAAAARRVDTWLAAWDEVVGLNYDFSGVPLLGDGVPC